MVVVDLHLDLAVMLRPFDFSEEVKILFVPDDPGALPDPVELVQKTLEWLKKKAWIPALWPTPRRSQQKVEELQEEFKRQRRPPQPPWPSRYYGSNPGGEVFGEVWRVWKGQRHWNNSVPGYGQGAVLEVQRDGRSLGFRVFLWKKIREDLQRVQIVRVRQTDRRSSAGE